MGTAERPSRRDVDPRGGAKPDPPVPIDNSYWVIPGKLLAGEYPGGWSDASARARLQRLLDAGVRCFVDLTERRDGLEPYDHLLRELAAAEVAHERFPVRDLSIPASRQQTARVLDTIDAALADDGAVYVHCWGGIGRTGTIVGCWLARHGPPGAAALDRLAELWARCPKSRWTGSPQTVEQEEYVRRWRRGE